MGIESAVPEILGSTAVGFPTTPGEWVVFFLSLIASLSLSFLAWKKPALLARFAFLAATLVNVLFQWPAALTVHAIAESLNDSLRYQACLNLIVFGLLSWIYLTRKSTPHIFFRAPTETPRGSLTLPFIALAICLMIYFSTIPVTCTGLYAFITDPRMTLWAREMSINLVPSGVVTTFLSIAINVFVPITAAIAALYALRSIKAMHFLRFGAWLIVCIACFVIAFTPGIKGLIVPAGIVTATGLLFWVENKIYKFAAVFLVVFVTGVTVVSFDTLTERTTQIAPYSVMNCANAIGSVKEARTAFTAVQRTGGYGLSSREVEELLQNKSVLEPSNTKPNVTLPSRSPELNRYFAYAQGLLNRIFIAPSNVGVLHFKYVENFGSPGEAALPFAIKIIGRSIDVPNEVFRTYIAPASGESNQEISGTAPTSSFISWPAYYGPIGLIFALIFVIGIDAFVIYSRRRIDPGLEPIVTGLVVSGALLFATADFATAMLTHGFLASLSIIFFWSHWTSIDILGKIRGTGPLFVKADRLSGN